MLLFVLILLLTVILSLTSPTLAHQAIAHPWPISNDGACRIGKFKDCPGPCPTIELRSDQTPDSPSISVRRSQSITVNIKRNNHAGGFSRWSLVNVNDMYDKKAHDRGAFLYTCGDLNITYCSSNNRLRDCTFDRTSRYYRHQVTIPKIYQDGVYVLGWAWYGGTLGGGSGGDFGDYYDCMYIDIKGGPSEEYHQPSFEMGASDTGYDGMCKARTTYLGDCWKEPCNNRKTRLTVPYEFLNGRAPKPISGRSFEKPYRIKGLPKSAPEVYGISVRAADDPTIVYASSITGPTGTISLKKNSRITFTCDVSGDVDHVVFYRNGIPMSKASSAPFSIAGAYWTENSGANTLKYHPWEKHLEEDMYSMSCGVHGTDDSVQFAKLDIEQRW